MRYLVIRNYLENVTEENLGTKEHPWFKVDRGNFRLTTTVRYPNEPGTIRNLIKAGRRKRKFNCLVRDGYRTKFESAYGVRSYQEITIEIEKQQINI